MHDKFLGSPIYRRVGNVSDQETWLANGKRSANIVDGIIRPMLPLSLNDFICVFLDTRVPSHLPRFRLLLKSNKSLRVDANGRWASRPIVGLTSWSTTASSILMATAGQILLKLDRVVDELNTPVRDTHDLLARVRAQVNSRRGNGD